MTDPLARIEAMIETLGSRQAGFWTPLDTSQGQVSNAKALKNRGFGHFGRFGHLGEETLADELMKDDRNAVDDGAETSQASRASSLLHGGVQSVQSVQNHEKAPEYQSVGFGHLGSASVQDRASGVQKPAGEQLNRQSAGPVMALEVTPTEWSNGVARLTTKAPPRTYPAHAWQQLIVDAGRFLDDWAQQAAAFGWPAWELFGCHRRAPWGRIDGIGLVLLLHGDPLAALTATEAVIRRASGARQTWHRKLRDPLTAAERCLVWDLV